MAKTSTAQRAATIEELIRLKKAGKTDHEVADALKATEHLYPYAPKTVWRIWKEYQEGKHQDLDTPSDTDNHRNTVNDKKDLTSESYGDKQRLTPSESEVLEAMKAMLNEIEIPERIGLTAPNRESPIKSGMLAARFPKELIDELKALPGPVSRHLERAARLYLLILKKEAGDV